MRQATPDFGQNKLHSPAVGDRFFRIVPAKLITRGIDLQREIGNVPCARASF